MKKTLWACTLALAFSCAAYIAVAVTRVADVAVAAVKLITATVRHGFELAAAKSESKAAGVVAFVQAKAFVLRLAKRERPEITGGWRMCTST